MRGAFFREDDAELTLLFLHLQWN